MKKNIFVSLVFILAFMEALHASNSLDENHPNKISEKTEITFDFANSQQLWKRALQVNFDESTRDVLLNDLRSYEKKKNELKKLHATGEDVSGLQEAILQKHFNSLISKYHLGAPNELDGKEDVTKSDGLARFLDEKLNKLWKKIIESHTFSEEELRRLLVEFKHHEDKIVEMNDLFQDMEEQEKLSSNSRRFQNDIELDDTAKVYQEQLHEEVIDGFSRLKLLSKKMKGEDQVFIEPRVDHLWQEALKKNFTQVELESLKLQLQHFQTHIDKHRFFKQSLKNSSTKIQLHKEDGNDSENQRKLKEKLQNLNKQVDKLHKNMKQKITVGVVEHSEL